MSPRPEFTVPPFERPLYFMSGTTAVCVSPHLSPASYARCVEIVVAFMAGAWS